ncbi:thiol-disulfide oxidoreductase DCC family protein [Shouchella sp. JSM 1781072]|uniref:thiol-disulfide oxidoreductase DCC family protein n=1 Tax=Shouchella sp. JSM 1781072 TaxID=3344581 RepID=UPI0035C1D969
MSGIILFDGVCNLCNHLVDFVIKRDVKGRYQFASLQSEKGMALLKEHNIRLDLHTMVVIENQQAYTKSDAALRVFPKLKGLWPLFRVLIIVPRPIRNKCYDWISQSRYRLFGKKESCRLPTKEEQSRFLT